MNDLDELWPALAQANEAAFCRFLAAAELPLRRSLAMFARQVDVEAVVQESLLRVWQVAPRFVPDGRPHGLLRLALRIARNLSLDEVKRTKRAALALAIEPPAEAFEPTLPDPGLRAILMGCFDELPPKPSEAMRARLDNVGADADSVLAAACRMSVNTFLQNVTRARRQLAECVQRRAGQELAP